MTSFADCVKIHVVCVNWQKRVKIICNLITKCLQQIGCRFMDRSEFASEADYLKGKKVVIVGCGAQGLNQGLNPLTRR